MESYKQKLIQAAESGLLIFVKWGLAFALAFLALQSLTNVWSGANNGTQSALYLTELQNKGWLPKIQNGQVPLKPEIEHVQTTK